VFVRCAFLSYNDKTKISSSKAGNEGLHMPSKEFLNRRGSIWERTSFEGKSLPELRREMDEQVVRELKHYDDVRWETGRAGTIEGKWVRPRAERGGLVYYLHGGGFTLGSSGIPLPFLMELSHRTGLTCFSADYRLAPEHTFPAAPEDAFIGYKALLDMGYAAENIVLCGESAGATLVLDIALMCRQRGLPLPAGIVAMSPVTDATVAADGTVLEGLDGTNEVMRVYAPGYPMSHPLISPALGDLTGFPPVFLSAGGSEVLMKDALTFADAAAKAGADVRLHVGQDMIHTYPLDLWDYPEAMTAFEEIVLFIQQMLRRNHDVE
jgi:salicylate hydroxylase